jgi:hypothetical protein
MIQWDAGVGLRIIKTAVMAMMTLVSDAASCFIALFYLLFVESPPAMLKATCGWLTYGRLLFFAYPKKSNQKKGYPG